MQYTVCYIIHFHILEPSVYVFQYIKMMIPACIFQNIVILEYINNSLFYMKSFVRYKSICIFFKNHVFICTKKFEPNSISCQIYIKSFNIVTICKKIYFLNVRVYL